MNLPQTDTRHIVFLFSDTGGGHRSAAEAIIEALNLEFPNQIHAKMVDVFRQYAPLPLSLAPEIYPPLTRVPDVWELGYRLSDGGRRTRMMYNAVWPYIRRSINRLLDENPCDLLVAVHPLINTPALRAMMLSKRRVPYVTVVTDLVSTHAAWFDSRANLVVVPTEDARRRGLYYGLAPEQLEVIGLPVADRFCQPGGDRNELRARLGWPQDQPVVLLVGGGDGMGPMEQVAHAIDHARLPAALIVIAGRNQALRNRLENHSWSIPVRVYGFVREMPDFMRAADILVTKAGPGTITEALIAGLPMVLYSRIPGQEDGNVSYVTGNGVGIWAPEPAAVAGALRNWLENPHQREQYARVCQCLARPQAARQIARILAARAGIKVPT
ncbi:MAG: glycosyltransferase [Chloroflexi bacterium]|nr:glycosyltransferase [Chloroflexota bacterium]